MSTYSEARDAAVVKAHGKIVDSHGQGGAIVDALSGLFQAGYAAATDRMAEIADWMDSRADDEHQDQMLVLEAAIEMLRDPGLQGTKWADRRIGWER